MSLPVAVENLIGFARMLRSDGFPVAPEQVIAFLEAVPLLGPRSMDDIREAALATLAPDPDRRGAFDRLFRGWFWGEASALAPGKSDDETRVKDDRGEGRRPPPSAERATGGALASAAERLAVRRFSSDSNDLSAFARALAGALPRRQSFRRVRARSRGSPDLRRSLRSIATADGDVPRLILERRPEIQRRLLLFIDISGSMKAHTAAHLRLAHAVMRGADRAEVFALGTRLTRISAPLRTADRDRALARVAGTVEDWDGGTRLGPTLLAFLAIPRFAALARGATVVILSDGLERGDPADMAEAFRRFKARAFRLSLLTPLAADPRFRPLTAALKAVLPYVDDLADGSGVRPIADFILSLDRAAAGPGELRREARR
jgi:uncharacterized protein with von Willebrand factor type A (vWA) domain